LTGSSLNRPPKRGDIVRVRFDPTEGSEEAGQRPALVLSPDFVNERSPIVIVAPLTTRKTSRVYAFEALIEPPEAGLTQRSKVMPLHIRGVASHRIIGYYGHVGSETMRAVEAALEIAVGLRPI
jgi:mRNA interferase MazF